MDIWKICQWREDAKVPLLCPTHLKDGDICCSIYMNLFIWAKDMHKKQFKHVENIFDHHLEVKRKLKKMGTTSTQKIQKCNRAVLIICCYWLGRLCTEKLLKGTKYIGCKQGIYFLFSWLWTVTEVNPFRKKSGGSHSFAKGLAKEQEEISKDAKCTHITSKFTMK